MPIETYTNFMYERLAALEIINDGVDRELMENYGEIKKGDPNNILDKLAGYNCLSRCVVKVMQTEHKQVRQEIADYYAKHKSIK